MRRNKLIAYLIGAGVSGTLIIIPYTSQWISQWFWEIAPPETFFNIKVTETMHDIRNIRIPFFFLPIIWGIWNCLYTRLHSPFNIGTWGALLGLILGILLNVLLYYRLGHWFPPPEYGLVRWLPPAASLLVFFPAVYYLFWRFIIGPINKALNVDT